MFNAYITGHGAPGLGARSGSCKMLHPLYTLTTSVPRVRTDAGDAYTEGIQRILLVSIFGEGDAIRTG